jgi:hypothetical protein
VEQQAVEVPGQTLDFQGIGYPLAGQRDPVTGSGGRQTQAHGLAAGVTDLADKVRDLIGEVRGLEKGNADARYVQDRLPIPDACGLIPKPET